MPVWGRVLPCGGAWPLFCFWRFLLCPHHLMRYAVTTVKTRPRKRGPKMGNNHRSDKTEVQR